LRILRLIERVRTFSPRFAGAAEVALTVLLGLQTARLIWLVVAAPPAMAPPVAIAAKPVDWTVLATFDAFGVGRSAEASEASGGQEGLGLRLFGVRAGGPGGGSAIIAGADGVQKSFAVGEAIAPGVVLAGVSPDHVVLARGDARSVLSFPENP